MKIDPHRHKERYFGWKEKTICGIPDISKANSDVIKQFLEDMERGMNITKGTKKGARSYIRLNTLRDRLIFLSKHFSEKFTINLMDATEEQLHAFFGDMRNGQIRRLDGQEYKSIADYVKTFKSFWNWYIKIRKKQGREIPDICTDLDTKRDKPQWVYLTEEQIRKLCNVAKYEYKALIWFLFDSGIRSPTELVNIRVSDLSQDCKTLHIRDEVSKTFGRKINLMICSDMLKDYIKDKGFGVGDYIFPINPNITNTYIKRLGEKVLGNSESLGGEKYSKLTMYDFRHNSACYWLPRYKSESALKYRFGWKKSEMIHYYTEFLGMKDTITEEDMLIDVTKTEIEKRLEKSEREKELLQEKMKALEVQMAKILEITNQLQVKAKI